MAKWKEHGGGDFIAGESSNTHFSRRQVTELLERYCRRLDELRRSKPNSKRVDLIAFHEFLDKKHMLNTSKTIGNIPGIEIGDKFEYRTELYLVGLHRHLLNGIDYMSTEVGKLATSIVASGHYSDKMEQSGELIYSGHGSNPAFHSDRPPEDQKLKLGNLALKNSMVGKTPVRVIRLQCFKSSKVSRVGGSHKQKTTSTFFVYDGLYEVVNYWQERGDSGKLVYQFKLKKMEGQPSLLGMRPNSFASRKGAVLTDDISGGKELKPVSVVNRVDNEKRPQFTYITDSMFQKTHDQCRKVGCDCTDGCSDSEDCACKDENGGKTPYDYNERLVSLRPAIYECGPLCKCYESCLNRVSQRGTKFQFEIFRTESREWGLRSRDYIPKGRFICEYAGEFLCGSKAEQRSINAKYFLKIAGDRIIDATRSGNIGRFILRSNTPNLCAKRVFNGDGTQHIVFFAMKNIAPLRELTWDHVLA